MGAHSDERLMADFACLEPIYIDGAAGYMNLGANIVCFYYRWQVTKYENGNPVFEKMPALQIIRPKNSLVCAGRCLASTTLTVPAPQPLHVVMGES